MITNCKSKLSDFKISHLNLRSIFTGFAEFSDLVYSGGFDVVAVTETWLTVDTPSDAVALRGYDFFRKDRAVGRGGGVGVYVRSALRCEVLILEEASQVDGFENIWIKININSKTIVLLGVIYRTKDNILDCVRVLDRNLPILLSSFQYLVVLGDVNIDLQSMADPLSELFDSFGFSQVIDEPTRITATSKSDILDRAGTISADQISDHRTTFSNLKLPNRKRLQKFITFRNFNSFKQEEYENDLKRVPWDDIYYLPDIESKAGFLTENMSALFREHAPIKTVRVNKPPAPWLTPGLKMIMKERDKALIKYRCDRSPTNWEAYKQMRNFTLASIRREKAGYLDYLQRQNSPGLLWQGLRNLNVYSSSKNSENNLSSVADPNQINDYFVSVYEKSDACDTRIEYYRNRKYRQDMHFSFHLAEPGAVQNAILFLQMQQDVMD